MPPPPSSLLTQKFLTFSAATTKKEGKRSVGEICRHAALKKSLLFFFCCCRGEFLLCLGGARRGVGAKLFWLFRVGDGGGVKESPPPTYTPKDSRREIIRRDDLEKYLPHTLISPKKKKGYFPHTNWGKILIDGNRPRSALGLWKCQQRNEFFDFCIAFRPPHMCFPYYPFWFPL